MAPIVDRLKQQFKGKIEFRRYDVTTDATGQQLADAVGAQYVPTFLFFDAKGQKSDMVVGGMTEATLKAKLDTLAR
jgi:thiol-disulfide isomerase/thioredoxin